MNGKTLHLLILLSICIIFPIVNVYGHGMGSETFPPVDLDDETFVKGLQYLIQNRILNIW